MTQTTTTTPGASDAAASFLQRFASPDPVVRGVAAQFAYRRGAPVLAGLADLAANPDPAVAKAARKAMEDITHHAARPSISTERSAVADALLLVAAQTNRPRAVRAHALFLLGFAGSARHVSALAPLLRDAEIGEDARMAGERIRDSVSLPGQRRASAPALRTSAR